MLHSRITPHHAHAATDIRVEAARKHPTTGSNHQTEKPTTVTPAFILFGGIHDRAFGCGGLLNNLWTDAVTTEADDVQEALPSTVTCGSSSNVRGIGESVETVAASSGS